MGLGVLYPPLGRLAYSEHKQQSHSYWQADAIADGNHPESWR
jgi:hypothetical protein